MLQRGEIISLIKFSRTWTVYLNTLHIPPLGKSDHQCLLIKPRCQQSKLKPISREYRVCKQSNIAQLTLRLNNENLNEIFVAQDIDLKVKLFTQTLLNILDETVPVRKIRMHPSDKPWMTPYMKLLKEGTTYNHLKPSKTTYNHLQRPTTTSKNSTTIYNHLKNIYNHPQTIEYHLKQAINV